MKYYVYLLVNVSRNKTISYVGYTTNLNKRLKLHNKGKGAKFTKGRKWYLAYTKSYKNKSTAMKNEYLLKKNYKKRIEIKKNFTLLNKWKYQFYFLIKKIIPKIMLVQFQYLWIVLIDIVNLNNKLFLNFTIPNGRGNKINLKIGTKNLKISINLM